MFDLVFLGTGATVPSAGRGLSALLVLHRDRRFLVDCGEGTLRQIRRAGIGLRRIDRVLLTHGHLDHVGGLAGLAGTLDLWEGTERLTIHGSDKALAIARALLEQVLWPEGHPGLSVTYEELTGGVFLSAEGLRVAAFPVPHHGSHSIGFRFEEAGHTPLDPDRLAALGVPEGEERHRLAHGHPVTLPDGRLLTPDQVQAPPIRGAHLAVVGDCEDAMALVEAVRGVDALVIEATYRTADEATARARGHLTVRDAAGLARAAGVGRLILTHQSDRYDADTVLAEARSLFPAVHIARDFDRLAVRGP